MSRQLPEFRAVIFDMDGLVLDTEPTYASAWRQASAEFGLMLDDEFLHSLFGRHADDVEAALEDRMGGSFDRDRFFDLAARYWWEHLQTRGVAPMPGLLELLTVLDSNHIPYALATNSDAPYARACLCRGGLEGRFPVTVTRDQVAVGKPEPDLFLEAARRLEVFPEHCLVLEDSPTGLIAARRAGAFPVLVLARSAPESVKALAETAFRSLAEVAALLRERNRVAAMS
ncbi:MAG: HAD family phosphatase [Methylococcaceae bacterium]|nr:HAD family phosphatase [Methylococcaceae bacterium]